MLLSRPTINYLVLHMHLACQEPHHACRTAINANGVVCARRSLGRIWEEILVLRRRGESWKADRRGENLRIRSSSRQECISA